MSRVKGTGFQAVIEGVRFDLARDLPESGELPVAEVANATGCKSPAAISRAFSKWAGVPPSRYRAIV